ncbi:hypothetical protein WJX73_006051 [Symbiochloris irregularis]|uniref:ABC transporter domain-containing protein n=1 Tax=Symbiochloris irregularis TaxID=706552 RepID=A0AAW1PHE4_9CHLO
MTALMGPSGSSKTTLLDVLAGRKTVGTIEGAIRFSGVNVSKHYLRRHTGYVEQFDTLLDSLTVREMLLYTAELKDPSNVPFREKAARVDAVLSRLALWSCRDVRIGSALARGISGGQAKRVNIGIALVTDARVLFLDEPTSGLDSYTANEVMTVVKGLAKTGTTICATIHSPTSYCFDLFDRVMMLLRGHLVYAGPNGQDVVDYFEANHPEAAMFGCKAGTAESTDFIQKIAPIRVRGAMRRVEWMVDLTTRADREGRALECARAFQGSAECDRHEREVDEHLSTPAEPSESMHRELHVTSATTNGVAWGWWIILKYRFLKDFTDVHYLAPRIADKVSLGLIIVSLYWGVGKHVDSVTATNVSAVLMMIAVTPGFSATTYVPSLVLERLLFYRERNDGLYSSVTYLLAKMTEELVAAAISSLIFCCLVFFPLKLAGSVLLFLCVFYLTTTIGIALAYLIAALSPTLATANTALPAYVLEFYSISGDHQWVEVAIESIFLVVFFLTAWAALVSVKHQKR